MIKNSVQNQIVNNTKPHYSYTSLSNHGKVREQNQDSIGIFQTKHGLLVIICDGLGGGLSGEFASKISVMNIHKNFLESDENNLIKRIRVSIERANKFVYEKSNGNLNFKGMATTCEVLLLNSSSVYWGHIGDSRIYFQKNKKLVRLTKDHSLIQKLIDEGSLSLKDSNRHPKKSVIMNAIGDGQLPKVDTSKMVLPRGEKWIFFVCTDGVTCVVTDNELENILLQKDIQKIKEKLHKLIEKRGAPDNYSFVIVTE